MMNGHANAKQIKVLEADADGYATKVYGRMSLGMFMTDRENLAKRTFKKLQDGSVLTILRSHADPAYPETDDAIRVQMFMA